MSLSGSAEELHALDRFLSRAEAEIALLARVRPLRPPGELERVRASFLRGEPAAPLESRREPPPLTALRGALELAATRLAGQDALLSLYAGRAEELALEAGIVEHLGQPAARDYCRRRFPDPEGEAGRQAHVWATDWLEPPDEEPGPRYLSDDERAPESLLCQVESELMRLKLAARVVFEPALQSKAAVADGVVFLKPGVPLCAAEARGIAIHEVWAHVAPRERARGEALGLLRVGSAGAADDEEGRALLIERRLSLLTASRRFELALRHQAAQSARQGASFVELTELMLALGAALDLALSLADRALRGGGLGRELIYLPHLHQVERAFAADPTLERWFERGRVSLHAARVLSEREAQLSSSSTSTGA